MPVDSTQIQGVPPAPRPPSRHIELIDCVDVGTKFGSGHRAVVAVYGATCTVHGRDRIAVVGPSGSGKSTLLHIMAGLERATAGRVSWPGLAQDPRNPDQVGLVFQAPTLIPALDVAENVALPLLLQGIDRAEADERAHAALAQLDLADLGRDLPQELSGGQAQRVVIARVLAARPKVIMADEPTSKLDRATAKHVIDVLLQACSEIGAALVMATHDRTIAARMTQQWQMRDGRLLVGQSKLDAS